jgi:hypothetical protein
MTAEITPQQMKSIALAIHFAPILKQIVKLATVAESASSPQYADFTFSVKTLCSSFPSLCRAGSTEQLIQRFTEVIDLCIAATVSASGTVN